MAITGPTLTGSYGSTGRMSGSEPWTHRSAASPSAGVPIGPTAAWAPSAPAQPRPWSPPPPPQPAYAPNPATFFGAFNPFIANQRSDLYGDYRLGRDSLGLSRADNAARIAELGPLRENALALLGLDRERIGLSREGLTVDEGEAHRNTATQVRGINSEYTSRGGWFAPEKGAKVEDSYASLRDTLSRIDLARRGLDVDERGVGLREEGVNLDFDSRRAELERAAAKYGLDARELEMRLSRGLRDLNLQDVLSVFDLFGQSDPQAQALAEQIIGMIAGG